MPDLTSPITKFYAGRNVFITGATGFVGVCLIEKILRDLPNIGKLYLLMRPKKGKSIEQRLKDLQKNSVFDKMNEGDASALFAKLVPISGDVGEENLGISQEDQDLLAQNISVVFHSAATLDFFQSLKETTNINLRGTRRVMELCKKLPKLEALVHVSSAFVNCFLLDTEEILYPAPDDPEKIINLAETLSDEALKELEPKLLKDHPNTYTFTKHLAEHEVHKSASIFPCGIVRPSMITAAWKQPVPGWTISKNGPQGFFMGASKGVIRRLPLDPSLIMDYIPVDVVVNQILVTGYYVNCLKVKNGGVPVDLQIFHCTSSTYKPFRFESLSNKMNMYMHKYPLKSAVWYPNLKLVKSLFLFRVAAIFFHFLPGYILDFVTKLGGGRPILVRLHTNVWNSLNTLERFIFTEWHYDNKKTLQLAKGLDPRDKELFFIDIGELKWEDYFHNMLLGVRQYLNNESPKNLEAARKKEKILLGLHVLLQCLFYLGVWKLIGLAFGLSNAKAALLLPVVYVLFGILVKNGGVPVDLQIFHCTSSTYKPFRFESLSNKMNMYMHKYPLKSAVWYPNLKLVKSLFLFRVAAIFFHFLPGYILDFVTKLGGGRPILVRLHTNVWNSLNTLERFIFTEWHYDNKKTLQLAKGLDPRDKELFFIDIGELKWEDYFHNMLLGVRQYLNNESPKNLEAARKKEKILLGLHVLLQCLFYLGVWKLIGLAFGLSNAKAALLLPVVYVLFGIL